jgi:hypothetical protein
VPGRVRLVHTCGPMETRASERATCCTSCIITAILLHCAHAVPLPQLPLDPLLPNPGVCPTSSELMVPRARTSSRYLQASVCPEFDSLSCCSASEERALADELYMYQSIYGSACSGCYENVRRLLCSVHCSSRAFEFVEVEARDAAAGESASARARVARARVRISPEFCARWYSSCAGANGALGGDSETISFCLQALDMNGAYRVVIGEAGRSSYSSESAPRSCGGARAGDGVTGAAVAEA